MVETATSFRIHRPTSLCLAQKRSAVPHCRCAKFLEKRIIGSRQADPRGPAVFLETHTICNFHHVEETALIFMARAAKQEVS